MTGQTKVVLVTAGTAGLGAAVARTLASDGFRVVVNYANNSQRAKDLVDELHKLPSNDERNESPRFECIQADVGDKAALDRMVKDVVDRFGRLDVVVSNAGWTRITNFMNLDEAMVDEDWEKCFLYNVKAHLWLFHAAKPELEKNSGAFITTASLAGIKPSGSSLAYSVTKAALIHLSKGLATIAAPNVRVNAMSPGLMLTEWGMQFAEEKREAARKASKLQRLPSIEDCANAIRSLATNNSITGLNLVVDSGTSV